MIIGWLPLAANIAQIIQTIPLVFGVIIYVVVFVKRERPIPEPPYPEGVLI